MKRKFVIGCDPEIRLNYDKYEIEYTFSGLHVGDDHCGKILEFRPPPGKPIEVTTHLAHLVQLLKPFVKKDNYDLFIVGGSGHPSTGGHVHFDYLGESHTKKLIDIMAQWGNTFGLLNPEPGRKAREEQGYGNYLDTRSNAPISFEWRAPSSWLSDPRWTYCILTVSWVAERNLDDFRDSLNSWKTHIKHIKQYLSKKEWKMFYPYYNMWYSLVKTNKFFPDIIHVDVWDKWIKCVPTKVRKQSTDIIKGNRIEFHRIYDMNTGKSVLIKDNA